MEQNLILRGRPITSQGLELIRSVVHQYWERGRTFISKELCRVWSWHQPNGALKDMACRELLRRLELKGLITLPPKKIDIDRRQKKLPPRGPPHETDLLTGRLKEFLPIDLRMVRGSPQEALHNSLIHQYHYLGYRQIVGPCLKYMAYIQNRPIACLSWGAAAWKVACRDRFIGWSASTRSSNLYLILNNTRFLILPWVRIPHLASHLLSQNIKVLASDWYRWYRYRPVLLETFVDVERFSGTSYRAANWFWVGRTQGRGKNDRDHQQDLPVKEVFLYPLRKEFREILNHESHG
ncbi:MAG: Druantia anti-phage system protein DruA [Thermodesulfobacteriota bacterium]